MTSKENNKPSGEGREEGRRYLVRCYHCNHVGHRSFDCMANVSGDERRPVICFVCKQPGHKAPDCPRKCNHEQTSYMSPKTNQAVPKPIQNVVNPKPPEKPRSCNWVAVQAKTGAVQGKVNGIPTEIVVDTGAEVTIVPAEQMLAIACAAETLSPCSKA